LSNTIDSRLALEYFYNFRRPFYEGDKARLRKLFFSESDDGFKDFLWFSPAYNNHIGRMFGELINSVPDIQPMNHLHASQTQIELGLAKTSLDC